MVIDDCCGLSFVDVAGAESLECFFTPGQGAESPEPRPFGALVDRPEVPSRGDSQSHAGGS